MSHIPKRKQTDAHCNQNNTQLITKPTKLAVALAATMVIAACGGGGGNDTAVKNNDNNTTQGTGENPTTKKQQPNNTDKDKALGKFALARAGSADAFTEYYKRGLQNGYNSLAVNAELATTDAVGQANAQPTAQKSESGASGNSSGKFGVSSTNLIEQGVDEADVVKQNATHIFTTSRQYSTALSAGKAGLGYVEQIHAFAKPNTKEVGSFQLDDIYGLNGFFLKENTLITLANKASPQWYIKNNAAFENGKIELKLLDVSDPSKMNVTKTYGWEGYIKASRRIGNHVYVISSASMSQPWRCPSVASQEPAIVGTDVATKARSLPPRCTPEALTSEDIAARMPTNINGKKINPADCLIPATYKKDSQYLNSNITLVTKVDLSNAGKHETTCIAASAEHVYMSPNSLYLAGYNYNNQTKGGNNSETLINKFNLKDTLSYAGTGRVAGAINWQSAGSFSMNEHNDVLRVVTTDWQQGNIKNMLHTLKTASDKVALETVATLPNDSNPQPIGKPNERIQGVRFLGDEAYVVTFRRTDPLYKIDLSDPSKPRIKGQLEMPGYSAYLHRINATYLLGVGYSANEKGRITGVQTTVFDTSGDNPKIVSQETVQDAQSWINLPIVRDSRAIMTLKNATTMRVAFPFSINKYNGNKNVQRNQATEYEVDLSSGKLTPTVRNLPDETNAYAGTRRALLDGDDVYYNQQNGGLAKYVWQQASSDEAQVTSDKQITPDVFFNGTVDYGNNLVSQNKATLLTSQAAYDEYVKGITRGYSKDPVTGKDIPNTLKPKTFDFTKGSVLIVDRLSSNGGSNSKIKDITLKADVAHVDVLTTSAGKNCLVTTAFERQLIIAYIPHEGEIVVNRTSQVNDCLV